MQFLTTVLLPVKTTLNLINEGKSKDSIFMMGNTMIDSLVQFESKFNDSNILDKNIIKCE